MDWELIDRQSGEARPLPDGLRGRFRDRVK